MYALNRAGTHVVIMSARPEYVRTTTEQWLDDKYVVYDELILRPNNDYKVNSAAVWKAGALLKLSERYNIEGFFDDSLANVKTAASLGIPSILYGLRGAVR